MKPIIASLVSLCVLTFSINAQTNSSSSLALDTNPGQATPSDARYEVIERGPDYRVWQKIIPTADARGKVTTQAGPGYIELETGMHYQDKGQWLDSKEEIQILPNGTAAAIQGQHQVYFPGDIYQGAIKLVTADGKVFISRPLGLSYFDGTNSVLIAELKDSVGELIGSNQVVYPDAFTDFHADLCYAYTKSGFEQDIILREQPPAPEGYGLALQTTRLQVLTEFFNPPQPARRSSPLREHMGVRLNDETLDFGGMKIGPGRAFAFGAQPDTGDSVAVAKTWVQLSGRQFLVEELPIAAIAEQLDGLPSPVQAKLDPAGDSVRHVVSNKRLLPVLRTARADDTNQIKSVKLDISKRGFVLDYATINTSSLTNYTFQGDTTYFISGPVTLFGTNTFEGGTVIKYAPTNSASMTCSGIIGASGSAYRPVIFTARDDNSVGETISGSSGTPTNYTAAVRLNGGASITMQNLRFSFAQTALALSGSSSNVFSHVQMVNCQNGINATNATFSLRNALFWNVMTNFGGAGSTGSVEQLTVDTATRLNNNLTLSLTNCLLVAVTNTGSFTSNSVSITNSSTGVFLNAGAGAHYLTTNSPYRNIGTTNINLDLLAALQKMTTYRPQIYSNLTISVATNFSPQAQRDTDTPDLGYHYDPIDYIADTLNISNAVLTVTNGAVIAGYNRSGIQLQTNSSIVSMGSPLVPNRFVRYQSVQEQSVALGGTNLFSALSVNPNHPGSTGPTATFRFTQFVCPAAGGSHLFDVGSTNYNNLLVQDCEFWGGQNILTGSTNTTATLRNNLFYRSVITAVITNLSSTLNLTNNLVFGTAVTILAPTNKVWSAFNNHFDSCSITNSRLTNGYNAYLNCSGRLQPTNVNDVVQSSGLAFQSGPLGTFYQPAASPLIDTGNTNANLLSLYHYTTQTNQVKETNSTVDIGYHYVALNPQLSTLNPVDSNGDGIPDYVQDANGNGLVDNGETNWGLAILTQPVSQVVQQGTIVTFNVTAGGIAPLSYRWLFNGTNLAGATLASLNLTNVQVANVGNYQVVVTNVSGVITSVVATLTLTCDTTPSGLVAWWQAESNALDSVGTNNGIVSSSGVTYASGKVGLGFNFDGTNGIITIPDSPVLQPTNFTIEAWLRFASLNSQTVGSAWPGEQFVINRNGQTDSSYFLGKQRTNNYSSITNDHLLFGITSVTNGQTARAWIDYTNTVQTNLWYHMVAVRGSNYIQLYINGQFIGSNNANFAQNYVGSPLTFGAMGNASWDGKFYGTLDEFSLYNRALSSNEIAQLYNAGSAGKCLLPPTITIQPTNQTATAGGSATFTVTATGSQPLNYQWWFNTTNSLAGATNASLTITNVQMTNAGTYSVVVTNLVGSVTSSNATLTLNSLLTITLQPTNQTVIQGASATFSVTATGTPPLSYQWWFNATSLLTGATNASLTLTNVQTTNAGAYTVVVSNITGSVTSSTNNGHLTVLVPPLITFQPTNQMVIQGSNAIFSVTVSNISTTPLSYQWLFNSTNIIGWGTNSSLTITNAQTTNAGTYTVMVTNVAGSVTSSTNNGILTVIVPPAIAVQPTNLTVIQGSNAAFGVTATGALLNYQWYFNSGVLTNSTNAVLTLPGVTTNQAGTYYVTVTNLAGSLTSSSAMLTVIAPPAITVQPTNLTVIQGSNATFGVTATGTLLNYQWYLNSGVLTNATAATLTLTNVQPGQAGTYSVVVSNLAGSVLSSNAVLTVLVPPAITVQPANLTVIQGSNATFGVTATGTLLKYQWYFNSGALNNSTNSSLTLPGVTTNQAGTYFVTVTNLAGSVTSSNALLTVIVSPAITVQPTNLIVIQGSSATFGVTATGTPLNYQWYFNSGVLTNATAATLTLTNVQPGQAGTYSVVVSNLAGSVLSSNAVLVVNAPPVITQQPVSVTTNKGGSATFNVVATGTSPFGYQWKKNGSNLTNGGKVSGASTSTLTLTNLNPVDAGVYTVVVSNAVGTASSIYAVLRVWTSSGAVAWGNYDCDGDFTDVTPGLTNAVAISAGASIDVALKSDGKVVAWGCNEHGQRNPPADLTNVVAVDAGMYHGLALRSDGTVTMWGDNALGQTNMPSNLTNVIAIDAGAYHSMALRNDGTVVAWGGNSNGQTNVPSGLTNVVAINACAVQSLALKSDGTVVAWGSDWFGEGEVPVGLSNVVAIAAGGYHNLALRSDGTIVAWGFNQNGETNVPADLTNVVAIAADSCCLALRSDGTVEGWGNDENGQADVPANLTNVVGIAVGWGHSVALGCLRPVIVTQPQSQTVPPGSNVTFNVTASGTAPLSYQWSSNGMSISGATNAMLVLPNVQSSQSGNYAAFVTNAYGSTLSSNALLAVNSPLTVAFTNPTNNQQFFNPMPNIPLVAAVTDSGGTVTNVQFFNGTNRLGNGAQASNTWTLLWFDVPAGSFSLMAIATDNTGKTATNSISIILNARPVVYITTPTNLQSFTEITNVTITAVASDPNAGGTITGVGFYSAGTNLPFKVTANGNNYSLTWSNLSAAGSPVSVYPVYAIATNNFGAINWSSLVIFRVYSSNSPPGVTITYPTNNAEFPAGSDITIAATTTNGSGIITNVEFFVNGQSIGSDPTAPYSISQSDWTPGTYVLIAKVTDDRGLSGVSAPITNTIDPQLPIAADGFWDQDYAKVVRLPRPEYVDSRLPLAVGADGSIYLNIYEDHLDRYDTNLNWVSLSINGGLTISGTWGKMARNGTNIYAGLCDQCGGTVIRIYGTNSVCMGDILEDSDFENGLIDGIGPANTFAFSGDDIYVGGNFKSAANTNVLFIAKFDSTNNVWIPVGAPLLNGPVYALATLHGKLIAGGAFTNAGGDPNASYIAQLDGTNWISLGTGVKMGPGLSYVISQGYSPAVTCLVVSESNLFVGGNFSEAGDLADANGLAIWNGQEWHTMNGGVGIATWWHQSSAWEYPSFPIVNDLAIHGNHVYVGGEFTNVLDGSYVIPTYNIASATWCEAEQRWMWSDLDSGVCDLEFTNIDDFGEVSSLAIREGNQPNQFAVAVNGSISLAGHKPLDVADHALWMVGYPRPADVPSVTLTNPLAGTVFTAPTSINIGALANSYTNLSGVHFLVDGTDLWTDGAQNTNAFGYSWPNPTSGIHLLTARAIDVNGLFADSSPVVISVKAANSSVIASNDQYTITENSPSVILYVLTNDISTNGSLLKIRDVVHLRNNPGHVDLGYNGAYLLYTSLPHTYGSDIFYYDVIDTNGNVDSAAVSVTIRALPRIKFVTPGYYGERIPLTNLPLVATGTVVSLNSDIVITNNIAASVIGSSVQTFSAAPTTNGVFSFSWTSSTPGFYTFNAVVTDSAGTTNGADPVTVALYDPNAPSHYVIAQFSNLVDSVTVQNGMISQIDPIITNAIFDLQGHAADSNGSNPVSYRLRLYQPDPDIDLINGDPVAQAGIYSGENPFAEITPGPLNAQGFHYGGDTNGALGKLDFTGIPNGVYELLLTVRGGADETNVLVEVQLNSQLKIGQFSFSEQDLSLPANGMPISIVRTYNSLNSLSSDFGYGWTFAINSMDVQLDDQRQEIQIGSDSAPFADGDSWWDWFPTKIVSVRTGGGWDVTLTLPDGRRVTFQAGFDLNGMNYTPRWTAPSGVNYTLTQLPDDKSFYSSLNQCWNNMWDYTFNNYDLPGYLLTDNATKTMYRITRGDPTDIYYDPSGTGDGSQFVNAKVYNQPQLTEIIFHSGDRIRISDDGIAHFDPTNNQTRAVTFSRDFAGRITAISDPNGGTNSLPAIKYVYNRDTGNLIQVLKLVDRNSGTYTVNSYLYNNPNFPHYITQIINGDGVPVARNYYDNSGRLTAVQDADGNRTKFIHNTANNTEVVVDRLNHTNTFVYDLNGNIIAQTNALGQVTTMDYDANNNKTTNTVFLNGQPLITSYIYDPSTQLLSGSTDPLGHTNGFTYDGFGNVLTSADALGHGTVNAYDNYGNLTNTTDALQNPTVNFYDGNSLLTGSRDAVGTVTTNYYDTFGNLTASATINLQPSTILSSNSFAYDANGNRTNSTIWRHIGVSWVPSVTLFVYDAMNRVVQTIDPDGTSTVVYDLAGKQVATIDKLGHTNSYTYDGQGRLILTTYPDSTTETSAYDAAGNRTNSVDRAGHATTYYYDALNRLTNTTYPDFTTSTTVYDGLGRVAQTIDALGTVTAFSYDAAGRRLAVTNAFGINGVQTVSAYTYDANGNQFTFTDGLGHTTTNFYDALNRQINVAFADGTRQTTVYDAAGRRIAQIDQAGIPTGFGYDGAGRLTSVTNAFGSSVQAVTHYQYDEVGNEIAQIDALNRTNIFAYDSMGRRTQHLMPGGQKEGFGYDPAGNLICYTNFNGAVITNVYDLVNRLTARIYPNGTSNTFTYTLTGQRQTMNDASGNYAYVYDSRDRLCTNSTPQGTLFYAYDANGNVTSITSSTPGGTLVTYQYDALNRLTNVLDARLTGTTNTAYGFDGVGNLQRMQYPNSVTNLYQYDSLNRLTNLVWKTNGTTIAGFAYQLGLTGNRTNLSETVGAGAGSRTYVWNYDALYRMTNENISVIGSVGYAYDPVGNRTNRQSSITQLPPANYLYNPNDWLTNTDSYDSNGNTTNSSGVAYRYDYDNRLTNYNNGAVIIVYDADGNRVKKITTTSTNFYLVDTRNPSGYAQVLEEFSVNSTATNLSKTYTYGLDLVSQKTPGSATNFFIYDGHGSTRLLTDQGGIFDNAFAYDAYGTLIASNSVPQTVFLYCGEQFDTDLGQYYFRNRTYNPGTGRFWTMDTFAGNNEDPLSLHKYLYCQGNPINGKDPSGFAMTWNHYMGYAAEEAIQDDYKESHPGDDVEYGQQQSFGESFLKPDIFNKTTKTFLEIKPITYSEIMKGLAKMGVCEAAYGPLTLGYSPEASWQPSSHLLETDDGELFFVMNVGGLVLYKDASEIEWTAITVTSIKTAKDLLPYLYRLSAAELRPVVARMALRVGIMYGADFGATMGVVTGNAVMGGAAAP